MIGQTVCRTQSSCRYPFFSCGAPHGSERSWFGSRRLSGSTCATACGIRSAECAVSARRTGDFVGGKNAPGHEWPVGRPRRAARSNQGGNRRWDLRDERQVAGRSRPAAGRYRLLGRISVVWSCVRCRLGLDVAADVCHERHSAFAERVAGTMAVAVAAPLFQRRLTDEGACSLSRPAGASHGTGDPLDRKSSSFRFRTEDEGGLW